ncbi:MAG: hypothetical protein C4333_02540 [Meiothermus sp.]
MRILFVALTALLSSCVLTVQPLPPAEPVAPSTPVLVNSRLGLPAYPGSRILKREEKGDGSSEVQFETSADLDRVYAHFHDYLSKAGWSRWTLERKGTATKLEARYQRNNTGFELQLEQEGRSGRYKLGIDF